MKGEGMGWFGESRRHSEARLKGLRESERGEKVFVLGKWRPVYFTSKNNLGWYVKVGGKKKSLGNYKFKSNKI